MGGSFCSASSFPLSFRDSTCTEHYFPEGHVIMVFPRKKNVNVVLPRARKRFYTDVNIYNRGKTAAVRLFCARHKTESKRENLKARSCSIYYFSELPL